MDKSISVVVPTYNRAHFLPECLDALLAQTVPVTEIIVVNDGSTDNTREVLRPYRDTIVYLEKTNGGKASALNAGLARVSGAFVWFFDDDDLPLPDALRIHLDAFAGTPEAGFTYSGYHLGETDGKTGQLRVVETFLPFQGTSRSLFLSFALGASGPGVGFMLQQGMLVRKSCLDAVGPFDEKGSEDRDMNLRLCRAFRGIPINTPTFIIRRHTGVRGRADAPYSFSEREKKLWEADQIVFRKLYQETPLNAFLEDPGFEERDPNWKGVALVNRAQIMARRELPEYAVADLSELRNRVLCGNINLDTHIVHAALTLEKIFCEAGQPDRARLVRTTLGDLLSGAASPGRLRGYVARYYYWKGLDAIRSGKPAATLAALAKLVSILRQWPGVAKKPPA